MSRVALQNFYTTVNKASKKTFPCPECNVPLLPKAFQKHCLNNHNINSRTHCVWCWGAESWLSGSKQQNVGHMIICFRKFMSRLEEKKEVEAPETFLPFDHTPMCPARDFFGHRKIPHLPKRAYDHIWPLEVPSSDPMFVGSSLNLVASYVRYYLQFQHEIDVLHVMVRANIFEGFLEAIDQDHGLTRTLKFSCWCNGGTHEIDKYRHHRHMIVVSKQKGYFIQNVWRGIKTFDRPQKNFPCLRYKRIESAMHLVNVIGYVSRRESRCSFSFDNRLRKENRNHFFCLENVPRDYKLISVLQWDGGLLELAKEKTDNMSSTKLVKESRLIDGRWCLQVKDIPGILLNMMLPMRREFTPNTNSEHFIHLTGGKKIYFEKNVEGFFSNDEWEKMHVANLFYHVVGHEYIALRPKHQTFLTNLQICNSTLQGEMIELKQKITTLETKIVDLQTEIKEKKIAMEDIFRKMERLLKEKDQTIEMKIVTLKEDMDNGGQYEKLKEALQSIQVELNRLSNKLESSKVVNNKCNIDTLNVNNYYSPNKKRKNDD